jgi:glucose 1-dehydrogenase
MVNNAGVETRTSILDTTEAQYDKVLNINLKRLLRHSICRPADDQAGWRRPNYHITSVHEDWLGLRCFISTCIGKYVTHVCHPLL